MKEQAVAHFGEGVRCVNGRAAMGASIRPLSVPQPRPCHPGDVGGLVKTAVDLLR